MTLSRELLTRVACAAGADLMEEYQERHDVVSEWVNGLTTFRMLYGQEGDMAIAESLTTLPCTPAEAWQLVQDVQTARNSTTNLLFTLVITGCDRLALPQFERMEAGYLEFRSCMCIGAAWVLQYFRDNYFLCLGSDNYKSRKRILYVMFDSPNQSPLLSSARVCGKYKECMVFLLDPYEIGQQWELVRKLLERAESSNHAVLRNAAIEATCHILSKTDDAVMDDNEKVQKVFEALASVIRDCSTILTARIKLKPKHATRLAMELVEKHDFEELPFKTRNAVHPLACVLERSPLCKGFNIFRLVVTFCDQWLEMGNRIDTICPFDQPALPLLVRLARAWIPLMTKAPYSTSGFEELCRLAGYPANPIPILWNDVVHGLARVLVFSQDDELTRGIV